MNCLLCHRRIPLQLKFYELFTLSYSAQSLCEKCAGQFQKISEKHCPRCYKDGTSDLCQDCKNWATQGVHVRHRAVFHYNQAMKEYFSNYKFVGDYRLHLLFAQYFRPVKSDRHFTRVPIPISDKRLQERGFNQVTAFLDASKTPYQNLLVKSDSLKQSSLDREERLASKNAFKILEGVKIPKKVVLIDDIYTTGATLQHAVQTLQDAGVLEIKTFSLCR